MLGGPARSLFFLAPSALSLPGPPHPHHNADVSNDKRHKAFKDVQVPGVENGRSSTYGNSSDLYTVRVTGVKRIIDCPVQFRRLSFSSSAIMSALPPNWGPSVFQHLHETKRLLHDIVFGAKYVQGGGISRVRRLISGLLGSPQF